MNILTSLGHKHLDGHKDLTAYRDIVRFDPETVMISAVDNKGAVLKDRLSEGVAVKVGTVLGVRPDFDLPVTSSVSGTIEGIVKSFNPVLNRPTEFFLIRNDKKYEEIRVEPLKSEAIEKIVEKLKEGGLVGLGGAGFPTYIKYKTPAKIDHILINAVECEPYLTTDYKQTSAEIDHVIDAANILVKALGAKSAIIAIKKTKIDLINLLKDRLAQESLVVLRTVPDVYPAGWERTLVQTVLKRDYANLPSEAGAIVSNVQTLAAAGHLFKDGKLPSLRVYTFAGSGLKESYNVLAPIGTKVKEIIENIGGYKTEQVVLINGGPMTGKMMRTDDFVLSASSSGVVVYDKKDLESNLDIEPCLRCGVCVDHCPSNLQPVLLKDALLREDYARCRDLGIMSCVECGLCSAVCPAKINLRQAFSKGKLMTRLKAPEAPKSDKKESK